MDILRVAAGGSSKPTHIMYRSNTSWMVLQKNLESLLAVGFIRLSAARSKTEYVLTEKGSEVLRDYVNIVERATEGPGEVVE
jgi:predicted transcriptional regulator